jgi:hypothetical protein
MFKFLKLHYYRQCLSNFQPYLPLTAKNQHSLTEVPFDYKSTIYYNKISISKINNEKIMTAFVINDGERDLTPDADSREPRSGTKPVSTEREATPTSDPYARTMLAPGTSAAAPSTPPPASPRSRGEAVKPPLFPAISQVFPGDEIAEVGVSLEMEDLLAKIEIDKSFSSFENYLFRTHANTKAEKERVQSGRQEYQKALKEFFDAVAKSIQKSRTEQGAKASRNLRAQISSNYAQLTYRLSTLLYENVLRIPPHSTRQIWQGKYPPEPAESSLQGLFNYIERVYLFPLSAEGGIDQKDFQNALLRERVQTELNELFASPEERKAQVDRKQNEERIKLKEEDEKLKNRKKDIDEKASARAQNVSVKYTPTEANEVYSIHQQRTALQTAYDQQFNFKNELERLKPEVLLSRLLKDSSGKDKNLSLHYVGQRLKGIEEIIAGKKSETISAAEKTTIRHYLDEAYATAHQKLNNMELPYEGGSPVPGKAVLGALTQRLNNLAKIVGVWDGTAIESRFIPREQKEQEIENFAALEAYKLATYAQVAGAKTKPVEQLQEDISARIRERTGSFFRTPPSSETDGKPFATQQNPIPLSPWAKDLTGNTIAAKNPGKTIGQIMAEKNAQQAPKEAVAEAPPQKWWSRAANSIGKLFGFGKK